MSDEIRIVVADDHPVFRHGLQHVIATHADIQVLESVGDGTTALDAIRRLSPDIAVLDVRMPGLGGLEVAELVREERLATRLMVLTMHAEPVLFDRAMKLGVQGYLLKDAALSEIVQAIRTIAGGGTFLSPALSEYLVDRAFPSRHRVAGGTSAVAALNDRERQILRLIAESQTSKEIAEALGLHYRTVENQRAAISQKLGLQGSHALVKFAFEHKTEL